VVGCACKDEEMSVIRIAMAVTAPQRAAR
jgi:hypothetical protein